MRGIRQSRGFRSSAFDHGPSIWWFPPFLPPFIPSERTVLLSRRFEFFCNFVCSCELLGRWIWLVHSLGPTVLLRCLIVAAGGDVPWASFHGLMMLKRLAIFSRAKWKCFLKDQPLTLWSLVQVTWSFFLKAWAAPGMFPPL